MKNTQVITKAATKTNPAVRMIEICAEGVREILDSPACDKFLRKLNGWNLAHDGRSYYRTDDADLNYIWDVFADLMDTSGRSGESAVDLEDAKVVAERFVSIMAEGTGFEGAFDRWVAKLTTNKPFWNAPECPEWDGDNTTLAETLRPICRSHRLAKASASDF